MGKKTHKKQHPERHSAKQRFLTEAMGLVRFPDAPQEDQKDERKPEEEHEEKPPFRRPRPQPRRGA